MKPQPLIALAVLAFAACAPTQARNDIAVAREIGVPPAAAIDALLLGEFDTNRDKLISQPEFAAGAVQAWLSASKGAPKIGILALQAWQTSVFGAADALPRFAFDSKFDGEITQEKFFEALNGRFILLDANKDGQISRTELYRKPVGAAQRGLEIPGPGGPPRGRPPQS